MGLLNSIFGKNPKKHEEKGDELFNIKEWGRAKIEYEKALDQVTEEFGDDKFNRRLKEKISKAKEALAGEHLETADELIEGGYYDDAKELLNLAIELSEDKEMVNEAKKLLQEIDELMDEDVESDLAEVDPEEDYGEEPSYRGDDDENFLALCNTLPKEVRDAYFSYGDSFKSGYLALNRGDFALAAEYLLMALDDFPEDNSAGKTYIPLELASAFLNLGKYDEALEQIEPFMEHHPDALPGYQLFCEVLWGMADFERADKVLAECPDELKSSVAYFLLKGETMFRTGDYGGAVSLYQSFEDLYGWNEAVVKAQAVASEAAGDFEMARGIYGEIMNQCSSCQRHIDPFVKRKFADISFESGDYSTGVLEIYLSLVQEDPMNAAFYFQRVSEIYSADGNDEEARRFRVLAKEAG